jgi:hypothetical protein
MDGVFFMFKSLSLELGFHCTMYWYQFHLTTCSVDSQHQIWSQSVQMHQRWNIQMSLIFFFNLRTVGGGIQTGSTRHFGHSFAYCTCPGWLWEWRIWCNEWQGKPKYLEKTCPDATLSTTNPTWPEPGLNLGRRSEKPTTNRFSYGTAYRCH